MCVALVLHLCLAATLPASADSFASPSVAVTAPLAVAAARPAEPSKSDQELVRLRDFVVGADRTLVTRRDAAQVLLDKDTPAARAVRRRRSPFWRCWRPSAAARTPMPSSWSRS
jgi:hypothetical protein